MIVWNIVSKNKLFNKQHNKNNNQDVKTILTMQNMHLNLEKRDLFDFFAVNKRLQYDICHIIM